MRVVAALLQPDQLRALYGAMRLSANSLIKRQVAPSLHDQNRVLDFT